MRALSGIHQEHTKSLQTSRSASCISSPSAVGRNCASRPERASSSSRKISRGKRNFPLASIPAADIPRSHSFYNSAMSDDSGRNSREETTGSAGDKKSTPLSESRTTGCGNKRKAPQPETFTPATIDRDLDPSKRPPGCASTTRLTDDKPNGDVLRMQSVYFVQKSGAHISYYGITCFAVYALMFSSSAHGGASDGI